MAVACLVGHRTSYHMVEGSNLPLALVENNKQKFILIEIFNQNLDFIY
jgi:hypothetical protein